METPNHPVNKLIAQLKSLKGSSQEATDIRKELHDVYIHEKSELEYARETGYWYYNDQPFLDDDDETFTAYWADVLIL